MILYAKEVFENASEVITQSAWLSGQLAAIAYHDPKSYPKSADDLAGRKREPEPFTKDQWSAVISHLTS